MLDFALDGITRVLSYSGRDRSSRTSKDNFDLPPIIIHQSRNSQDLVQSNPFPIDESGEILTKALEYRRKNLSLVVALTIDYESGNAFESWLHDINAQIYVIALRLWRSLEMYLSVKKSNSWLITASKKEAYEMLIQYSVLTKSILPKDLGLMLSFLLIHSRDPPIFLYRYIQNRLAQILKEKWQQFNKRDVIDFHRNLSISSREYEGKREGTTQKRITKALESLNSLSEYGYLLNSLFKYEINFRKFAKWRRFERFSRVARGKSYEQNAHHLPGELYDKGRKDPYSNAKQR
ncbi:DgyrCDS6599 [Dimorphilus gyrociliatus]|uniref:DgyrCDS6599 n=1 Tax=Dimorphilus gyrociliatus TaxID=2664684 RepID=A0A7I8VTB4_9ANNE|nr:DgyrCDS6599 [Dimorphilus gyrociliatus]